MACEDGMFVFSLRYENLTLEMFVWVCVGFKVGAFRRQVAALHTIARELDAQQIAFQSRRRGWVRHLGPEWVRRGTNEFVTRTQ